MVEPGTIALEDGSLDNVAWVRGGGYNPLGPPHIHHRGLLRSWPSTKTTDGRAAYLPAIPLCGAAKYAYGSWERWTTVKSFPQQSPICYSCVVELWQRCAWLREETQ